MSGYFDRGVLDNWTVDKYDWDKEIVLITGGAGGIGGHVVKLLAERGIKVVVLDVIPMTFEARKYPISPAPPRREVTDKDISIQCSLLQLRHYLLLNDLLSCGRSPQRCWRSHNPYQQRWSGSRETNTRRNRERRPLHI